MSALAIKENTSPAEVLAMAYSAKETLRARARNTMREYNDRIKQCDDIMRAAAIAAENTTDGALELPGTHALSLTPEKHRLLLAPTHGL